MSYWPEREQHPIATKNMAKTYESFLLPTPVLDQACSIVGHVNIFPDPDGKVRQIPLIVKQVNGATYPSLSIATLFTLFHQTPPDNYSITNGKLNILMRDIPVDASYFMRLNYSVANSKPTYISYGDIINNNFDPLLVKNKIVLIGMTGTGDSDQFSIPNSSIRIPGVYIHAAAIDTILRTQFLSVVPLNITLLIMLLLVLLCAVLLPGFGTWHWTDVLKGTGINHCFTLNLCRNQFHYGGTRPYHECPLSISYSDCIICNEYPVYGHQRTK